MPTKPGEKYGEDALRLGAQHGKWAGPWPLLTGWLCDALYPDGDVVGPTTLTLSRDGAHVVARLKIADGGGLVIRGAGESPEDALTMVELALGSDPQPWERDRYPLSGAKRRGKK